MSLALPVDGPLLAVGGLLLLAILVASLRDRFQVPGALLFLGLGMLVGDDGLGLIRFDETATARDLGIVALVVILFEGGLTTKPSDLRRAGVPGFVLANVGVLVTTVVTGASLRLLLGLDWQPALLLGAIVSSTDAAAVFDLLRRAPLPRRVGAALEVESGANDPFAVILTLGILATFDVPPSWQEWFVYGARQLLGGIAVGVLVGLAGAWLLRAVRLPAQGLYPVAAFALAFLTYGLGAAAGASGLFAAYLAGIVIGTTVPRHRRVIRNFATSIASTAEIGLFLMLGLLVFPSQLPAVALPALAVTAILLLVARPVAVAASLTPFGFGWREQAVTSWAGLRGAVPIVLATFPFTAGVDAAPTIFNVVFFVVLVSVTIQGLTVVPLVRRLGLATARPAWESVADTLPLDTTEATMVELTITADMAAAGRPLADMPRSPGMLVTTLVRGGAVLVPTGATILRPDDLALVTVAEAEDAAARVLAWARGEPDPEASDEASVGVGAGGIGRDAREYRDAPVRVPRSDAVPDLDLHLTDDADADRVLSENPLALLIGMLLDQQVPMEWAFAGPATLQERLDAPLDAGRIAAMDPAELEALFREKPALHRYPGSMAKRVHALCQHLVEEYGGDPEAVWRDAPDGRTLLKRLKALPGYGDQKARIFLALLGKQCGVTPDGWREAAGDYGDDQYRSIADVTSPDSLLKVRDAKQAAKARAKEKG